MALLVVLLLVALLAALVTDFLYEMRVEAALVGNIMGRTEARLAAESAVATGMALLYADVTGQVDVSGGVYDAFTEPWAEGVPYEEVDHAVFRTAIADEFGKLNLGALLVGGTDPALTGQAGEDGLAPPEDADGGAWDEQTATNEVLEAALRNLLLDRIGLLGAETVTDPTDAILDWLDPDDVPRPEGAEADYYAGLDVPVGIKNGPMDSLEELLMVKGVTPDLYFGDRELEVPPLADLLTVRGHGDGKLNANTAPYEVLRALGDAAGRPDVADTIVEVREESPFTTREELETYGVVEPPDSEGEGQTQGFDPFLVASRVFRVSGDGRAGKSKVRIVAFVYRNPDAILAQTGQLSADEEANARQGGESAAGAQTAGFHILDWRVYE
jgi:general secretion pathway protein K